MEHESPTDFAVNAPFSNDRMDAYSRAIQTLEPALRAVGKTIDFGKMTALADAGIFQNITDEQLAQVVKQF